LDTGRKLTILHKLDPRIKILLTLLFTALIFIVDRPIVAAAQALVFLGLWFAAGLPFKKIMSHAKLLSFLIILIIILQMLFGPEKQPNHYILKPLIPEIIPLIGGRGVLKWDGLFTGLMIACRLAALVVLMPMLTMTTSPHQLALGFTKLGMNYRAAYIITTAFNLIPGLEEEGRVIMEARKLRGIRAFEEGGLFGRLKEYPALALPLIINAMRRAQMMGIAMDARGFGAHRTKTWLEKIRLSAIDRLIFAAALVYTALVLVFNFGVS
jgi:energy-coupling factor transport system permease protein